MSNRKAGGAAKRAAPTDEITAARKRRRRRYKARRYLMFFLALALAFVIVLAISNVNMFTFRNIGDTLKTTFAGGKGYPVLLSSTKPLMTVSLSGCYATLTDTEVIVNANGGKELQRIQHNYSNPAISGNGAKFILYDRGNKSFNIYNRTGLLFASESEQPIIAADVASNGTAILLTQGDRSVSELQVLSRSNYTTLFTWYGANGFPLYCGISENGNEIYVAGIKADLGGVRTVLTFIDASQRQQNAEIELSGTFIRCWQSGARRTVLTDKAAYLLSAQYTVELSYNFPRMSIIAASKESGSLALAFGDNNQPDVNYIVILSEQMRELTTIENIGIVKDVYMGADRLFVLSDGVVYALQTDGKLVESYETDLKASRIFMMKNRLTVLLPDRLEQPERTREQDTGLFQPESTPSNPVDETDALPETEDPASDITESGPDGGDIGSENGEDETTG